MKRCHAIWIGILFLLTLTGCWDEKEIGEINYATALGIDYKDDKYILYVQILDFSNVAKQEGTKQSDKAPIFVGKSSGSTLNEAVFNLYKTSQQNINWGQVGTIIYSESTLNNGIEKVEQAMRRNGEFRYTPWMFGTHEPIEKIFGVSGFFRLPPLYTILYKPNDTYKGYSYIEPIRMYKLVSIYQDPGGTSLLPSISIDKDAWKEQASSEKPKETLKINGVYPITHGKTKEWMSFDDVAGLRWIEPDTKNTPVKIVVDGKEKGIVVITNPSAHIKLEGEGEESKFIINVEAEGQLTDLNEEMPSKNIEQIVKEQIKKEIITTYQNGINKDADIFNLKNILFRKGMEPKKVKDYRLTKESLKKVSISFHLESKGIYD
ncbi:Ger(x)C family spore germination protein [Rossellomorea sp. BNER]|uniref:Ger(x)C family spore germination protein n=1 Tax=Rossellomorea sp. BNER TaxID=2962031 RepID=UPI003AF1E966|nr:Ger(x)C family spore germination protein [Rossellomorea sp. BNER]